MPLCFTLSDGVLSILSQGGAEIGLRVEGSLGVKESLAGYICSFVVYTACICLHWVVYIVRYPQFSPSLDFNMTRACSKAFHGPMCC